MRRVWTALLCVGMGGCNGCGPSTPPVDTDDIPPLDTESDPPDESGDSDGPPRCALHEVEPNNGVDLAAELPWERRACGDFEEPGDADFWTIDVTEEGWVALDLWTFQVGSPAQVTLRVASAELGVAFAIGRWQGLPEAHARFFSPPGRYEVMVRQTVGLDASPGQGEGYFYELRASVSKPVVDADLDEQAGNDLPTEAQPILEGPGRVTVYGRSDVEADEDWFEVVVPPGRHTVTLSVGAADLGSAGDFTMQVWEAYAGLLYDVPSGRLGYEPDPYLSFTSDGGERLRIKLIEDDRQAGDPIWYALTAVVEGP